MNNKLTIIKKSQVRINGLTVGPILRTRDVDMI
jgi:hypothetical protein